MIRKLAPALAILCVSCGGLTPQSVPPLALAVPAARIAWPPGLPVYDHVVIVVEENKDYEEIVGNPAAPYINGTLRAEGADLTRMYAEEHPSEGNYFWLFSGSDQNVGFADRIPTQFFTTSNLGEKLIGTDPTHPWKAFKGYSEGLPEIGSTVHASGNYARKHVPWVSFSNLPLGHTGDPAVDSFNVRFVDFPPHYKDLPRVSFVIPDLIHDMHDGAPATSIPAGDRWLKDHLDSYYQWAKQNNSLLILTFDEDDHGGISNLGLTDPAAASPARKNRIVTILAGAHVKPGVYDEGKGVTQVNLLRTLEAMYGLERSGRQQSNARAAGIGEDFIKDVFETTP